MMDVLRRLATRFLRGNTPAPEETPVPAQSKTEARRDPMPDEVALFFRLGMSNGDTVYTRIAMGGNRVSDETALASAFANLRKFYEDRNGTEILSIELIPYDTYAAVIGRCPDESRIRFVF